MSANNQPKTIVIDGVKYGLYKIEEVVEEKKKYYSKREVAEITTYSLSTISHKVKDMIEGIHYFKPNSGKILFDESAIDFLAKGGSSGKSVHEGR